MHIKSAHYPLLQMPLKPSPQLPVTQLQACTSTGAKCFLRQAGVPVRAAGKASLKQGKPCPCGEQREAAKRKVEKAGLL